MAALATMTIGDLNGKKKEIYPLFQKGIRPRNIKPKDETSTDLQGVEAANSAPRSKPEVEQAHSGSKKKIETSVGAGLSLVPPGSEYVQAELLDIDPNKSRKKRRRTDPPNDIDPKLEGPEQIVPKKGQPGSATRTEGTNSISRIISSPLHLHVPLEAPNVIDSVPPIQNGAKLSPETVCDNGSAVVEPLTGDGSDGVCPLKPSATPIADGRSKPVPVVEAAVNSTAAPKSESCGKPKKILKLNPKTGTIGSPPAKKLVSSIEYMSKAPHRKSPKSKMITIRYGDKNRLPIDIGAKIEQILNGTQTVVFPFKQPHPEPLKITGPAQSSKALHPLFLGKAAPRIADAKKDAESDVVHSVTPAHRQNPVGHRDKRPNSPLRSSAGQFAGFGRSSMILKFPGAVEPAWPWQGMVHVRGYDNREVKRLTDSQILRPRPESKKSKYQAVEVVPDEDIIANLAEELRIGSVLDEIHETNMDDFTPLPLCLRLPTKHYEGGSALQRRLKKQLRMHQATEPLGLGDDGSQTSEPAQTLPHPALTTMYNSIPATMSAFDHGQCETQSWTHKYAPKCAANVLQNGREALILKDWLQRLTVESVETGLGDRTSSRASSVSGKRKRKSKKLDGFVVSSDEEMNDMDEITEPEDNVGQGSGHGLLKKTVIRAGDAIKESGKVTNTVVISGPHGSGKTAAVYAVANELGFEVFEINSSSRRSGKDILEKVGDMTRNHLVQRSQGPAPVNEDEKRVDAALAQDLQSGRQGTMNSFFKSKAAAKPEYKTKSKAGLKQKTKETPAPKTSAQKQKQSLILVEEADILYKEDQGFWSTILELTCHSKRPIIITCSDETALPMNALKLYAAIRFTPASTELAIDYMLLVAGCEGHVLRREAVKTLYEGRCYDLRASLTDLNFWCQFAVGDPKNGLDWFYPRWRKGDDIDEHGETIRVVSQNTYEAGMGWLSQDVLESHAHYLNIEEEMLHEAWDGWQLDLGNWQENISITAWANTMQQYSVGEKDNIAALNIYSDFIESMSEADLFSAQTFAPDIHAPLDFSMPILSAKAREDYVLGQELIEGTPVVDFNTTSKNMSLWMRSRARKHLQVDQHIQPGFEIPPQLDRPSESDVIRLITAKMTVPSSRLSRPDFSLAFDPISEPEKYVWNISTTLEASSFDRTLSIITLDLAPYVRSIVAYDARLQEERMRMSNLLSEGGRIGKRMRTTRAAMSALEGGTRSTTRKERYFGERLNAVFVARTGRTEWTYAAVATEQAEKEKLREKAEVELKAPDDEGAEESA